MSRRPQPSGVDRPAASANIRAPLPGSHQTYGGVRPFRIAIPQDDLDRLHDRLDRVRWAEELPGVGWEYGVPVGHVQRLVEHWRTAYDWRGSEARLNTYPQFITTIDGQNIHFLHIRSPEPDPVPLIVTHGWPGSVAEFLDVIGPLSNPRAHGANPALAFDLVIPSLPGFGFSGPTTERGWGPRRIAAAWAELMIRLGYDRYGAIGNDWGSFISPELGRADPEHVIGVHVTQLFSLPTGEPGELNDLSDEDQAAMKELTWLEANFAYSKLQSTQPQTLAHALADSPVGLLAWHSQLERSLDADFVITNAAIHWLTGTTASAMRIYYEFAQQPVAEPTTVPIGLAQFSDDFKPIRRFAERDHKNIISWNVYNQPGHFAAHQSPDLLVTDIRAFYAKLLTGRCPPTSPNPKGPP
jgi:pimeloyl-ACP methyl ester carboxylesterase